MNCANIHEITKTTIDKLRQGNIRNNIILDQGKPYRRTDLEYQETQYQKFLSSVNGLVISDLSESAYNGEI